MPLFPLCCLKVLDKPWWCPSFSRLEGQGINCQSQTPCDPLFQRRCSEDCHQSQQHAETEWFNFASFACQGQQPVQYSHCSYTNPEIQYIKSFISCSNTINTSHIVKWVMENNQPANIVNDPELCNLLSAGHPHVTIPSPSTVLCNINSSFVKC
jgi:hypothetical protein